MTETVRQYLTKQLKACGVREVSFDGAIKNGFGLCPGCGQWSGGPPLGALSWLARPLSNGSVEFVCSEACVEVRNERDRDRSAQGRGMSLERGSAASGAE